jgi:hypothetical protein
MDPLTTPGRSTKMDALTDPPATAAAPQSWTGADKAFLVFIAFVVAAVTWLGVMAHKEALKTEGTKRNGERWAAWLTQESAKRFAPDYALGACAGGLKSASPTATTPAAGSLTASAPAAEGDTPAADPAAVAPVSAAAAPTPNTWGTCLEYLTTQSEFKDMVNPFTGKAPLFIPACNPADHSLAGSIVIDKVTPNPPGSAVPTVTSQLLATDPIADKMQLKIAVCDKGSYAVKIAELEF